MTEKEIPPDGLLDKIIGGLMEERVFGIAYQKTRETTEHDKWLEESTLLSVWIKEKMGSDSDVFNRYEELSASCESAFLKGVYAQGFRDGMDLLKTILYVRKENI